MPRKMKGASQPRRQQPYQASSSNSRSAFTVLNADPGTSRTLRWAGSISSTQSLIVTRACLLSAIVATAGVTGSTTALAYVPIYESVRIKRARIVLPPPTNVSGGTITQEINLEWTSYMGKDIKWSVVGASSTGGTFSCRPPAGTRAAMWGSANTSANAATSINEVLFSLGHDANYANNSNTVNCIIELDLDFVQANDTRSVINVVCTAFTNGQSPGLYQCPLDLVSAAGAIGTRAFDPLGVQDVRLDAAEAAILFTSLVRTN